MNSKGSFQIICLRNIHVPLCSAIALSVGYLVAVHDPLSLVSPFSELRGVAGERMGIETMGPISHR